MPRFAEEERAAGWHVQYDQLVAEGRASSSGLPPS